MKRLVRCNTSIKEGTTAEEFFTKEDITELANSVCEQLDDEHNDTFRIFDVWLKGNVLHLEVESARESLSLEGIPAIHKGSVEIDMENIDSPSSISKYTQKVVDAVSRGIYNRGILGASMEELPLEPPETDSYNYESSFDEVIEFYFGFEVTIDDSGNINDDDDYGSFARNPKNKDGQWYASDYDIHIDSPSGVAENFYDLLYDMYSEEIPDTPGRYKMGGLASLTYEISGIDSDSTKPEDIYYTEDAEADFVKSKSQINNLIFKKI